MSELDEIDGLAAEYVLGTLDADERNAVAARRQRESALDQAIARWERRLAGLASGVAAVVPPRGLLEKIEARIAAGQGGAGSNQVVQLAGLQAQVKRWKRAAVAASALAAALALTLGISQFMPPRHPDQFVAVFQKNDESPAFLLSIDLPTRRITVRQVAAPREPGKTFQLWIASDQIGPAPRSLGVMDEAQVTRELPFEPALLRNATFGISVEDAGGSRTGRPAAGALHARLMVATP